MVEAELDRNLALEDVHEHLQLLLVGIDVDDLNPERGKLKVMVAIFGRMTPVELEYYQVERL